MKTARKIIFSVVVLMLLISTLSLFSVNAESALIQEQPTQHDVEGEFAGGSGTTADPYLVSTKEQLNNVRNYLSSHFRQINDIEFTSSDFEESGEYYNDGNGWKPIGRDYYRAFIGSYDGNGYNISGLTITTDASEFSNIGLFGYVIGDIVNVNMTDISYSITGYATIGGIAGENFLNDIIGCSVSGTINAESGTIGGIVGNGYTVNHCNSSVDINIEENNSNADVTIGGITSYVNYINNCKNTGNINATGKNVIIGGIVGFTHFDVSKCENTGNISASGVNVNLGGIVGRIEGSDYNEVSECVNKGSLSTDETPKYAYVGGIVGYGMTFAIRNCYVTDTCSINTYGTSTSIAGGICGYGSETNGIRYCYSLVNNITVNTDATTNKAGGIAGYFSGSIYYCIYRYSIIAGYYSYSYKPLRYENLSSYESSDIYNGFNFSSIWVMGTDTYKYAMLKMESGHTHSLSHKSATVTHETSGDLESWYCSGCQTYFRNNTGTLYVAEDMLFSYPLSREGSCGSDVKWKLTYEGDLTISGSGNMNDYTNVNQTPWYAYCNNIKTINVESGVTSVGNNAFRGCVNLTKVVLNDGIQTIGNSSFSECNNITQLKIPSTVTSVGNDAFSYISNLIICFEGNAPEFGGAHVFLNTEASIYYKDNDTTWTSSVKQGQIGSITWNAYSSIDDIIIASKSFDTSESDIMWELSFTGKLTVTGKYGSTNMLNYSSGMRPSWEEYKDYITYVKLVNINRIGSYTFYNYSSLKNIDCGYAAEVSEYAFYHCSSLESIYLEACYLNHVIENRAFAYCNSLKKVAFPLHTTIEDNAFLGCNQLEEIYITNYSEGYSIPINASEQAFEGITACVYVPSTWKHFKDYGDFGGDLTWQAVPYGPCGPDAFWEYDANSSTVTISGTGSISSFFSGAQYPWYGVQMSLTKVQFEDGIVDIPSYVFEYMSSIETVILPNTLQSLACNAFNGCSSLNNLIIPASLISFSSGDYFNRCDSFTDVYYMGSQEEWNNIENNDVVGTSYDYIENIHYLVLTEEVEATCTNDGVAAYYQFDDTSVYSNYYNLSKQPITQPVVIPALGHDYKDTITSPTCTERGYTTHVCERCSNTYVDTYVNALGHDLINDERVEPTCTTTGLTDGCHCSRCDYEEEQEVIPALGHDYKDTITAPTCTERGYTTHVCERCSNTYVDTYVNALGHDLITDEKVEATCTTTGLTEGSHCSRCEHKVEQVVIPALGHDLITDEKVEATCTTTGLTEGSHCSRCDHKVEQEVIPALGHDIITDERVDATCTTTGLTEGCHCSRCDYKVEQDEIPALGHDYKDTITATTCTERGYTTHVCERCSNTYVDTYVNALGHDLITDERVEPTCTTTGLTDGCHCSRCDYEEEQEVIPALGHDYKDTITAPTCTERGYTTHVCERCSNTYVDTYVNALGHDLITDEKVEATCTTTGLTEGSHCSRCDHKVEQEVIPALGHDYKDTITAPTCTERGYTTHVCERCSNTYVDTYVNALGHDLITDDKVDATCTTTGLTEGCHCSRCDYKVEQDEIPALGHDYKDTVTAPTCTERGYTTHVCERCSDSYIDSYVNAFGHDIVTDAIVDPTCSTTGLTEGCHCSRCDYKVEQEEIPALGHDYKQFITSPTCTERGYTTHTCSRCKDTYYDSYVNALGHNLIIDEAVDATCVNVGLTQGEHCTRCDHVVDQVVVPATGHTYVAVVTSPTCTESGYTTYTCHCGEIYIDNYTEALGHNLIVDEAVDATCTAAGLSEGCHCTRCDYEVEQVVVPTLGHDYQDIITSPTCTERGYTTHTCSRCRNSYVDSYVNALDHNIVNSERVEPTCTGTGLTEGSHCSRCDHKVTQEVIPALGHDYKVTITSPTCTENGYTTYTCSRCKDTYYDSYVNALGHILIPDKAVDATCTKTGLTEGSHCIRCSYKVDQIVIPALGHNYEETITAPTCTEKGYTTYKCYCGETYVGNYVDALGHDLIIEEAVDATCTTTGLTQGERCTRCDHVVKQEVVEATGHNMIDVTPEMGYESNVSKVCTKCGHKEYGESQKKSGCRKASFATMNYLLLSSLLILVIKKKR